MGARTRKKPIYIVVFGKWTYQPEGLEPFGSLEAAKFFADELIEKNGWYGMKATEFKGETILLITNGHDYVEIQKKVKNVTVDERAARKAADKYEDMEMIQNLREELENHVEQFLEDPKEEKWINRFTSVRSYRKDQATGRVRIPTHERKKLWRALYPNGTVREIIVSVDAKQKKAIGEGRVYKNKKDMGLLPSEIKTMGKAIVVELLKSNSVALDAPVGIGQSYETYEELEKAMYATEKIKNGGQHYPEAARTAAVGSALTNAGCPEYLDEIKKLEHLQVLDLTEHLVKVEIRKFDKKKGIRKS